MRNFRAEPKEGATPDEPCRLQIELHEEIGLPSGKHIFLYMPDGTNYADAKDVSRTLNALDVRFQIKDT
jgi:hypothetical protein